MNKPKQSIPTCIKNASILILIVFSLVLHLFINATGGACSFSGSKILEANQGFNQTSNTPLKISGKAPRSHHRASLHFNKRFQPESFIVPNNNCLIENLSESYVEQYKIGQPTSYLLFSVIIAQSMRGPPVAA